MAKPMKLAKISLLKDGRFELLAIHPVTKLPKAKPER